MANIKDFDQFKGISGVREYLLLRHDGKVMCTSMAGDPMGIASTVIMSGMAFEVLEGSVGKEKFLHYYLERREGNGLVVFSLGNYFFVVIKEHDALADRVIDEVQQCLHALTRKGVNHPGLPRG